MGFGGPEWPGRLWANILLRANINSGDPTGDGETENVPAPASPDGSEFRPLKAPWGVKSPQFHHLIDEFPIGDRGSGPIAIPTRMVLI